LQRIKSAAALKKAEIYSILDCVSNMKCGQAELIFCRFEEQRRCFKVFATENR